MIRNKLGRALGVLMIGMVVLVGCQLRRVMPPVRQLRMPRSTIRMIRR